jgi:hypothetical protein
MIAMRSPHLGTTSDRNFVTFVLFVVTKCLTTKDAKHTKEEIQRAPREMRSWHDGKFVIWIFARREP